MGLHGLGMGWVDGIIARLETQERDEIFKDPQKNLILRKRNPLDREVSYFYIIE